MNNYMFINFHLRKSTKNPEYGAVYVRVTINRQRITLGPVTVVSGFDLPKSIMIPCTSWDDKKKKVKPNDSQALVLNKAIAECENKLNKLYAQHEGYDVKMSGPRVKAATLHGEKVRLSMPDLMERFLSEKVALRTNPSTIDTYRFKFRPLAQFLKSEKITDQAAEEFTPGTLKRYRTYLITQRGNAARSADKTCQVVKTILLWAAENEYIRTNPLLNTRIHVDKTPNLECLTQEEVNQVWNANLEPRLREIADIFMFACYTGLAYQDLKDLTPDSIQLVEGAYCIVGKRTKTGTEFYIPISQRVWTLIDKYKGVKLPIPSNQQYNTYLKHIMFVLGINKRITTHTARKTFADWCINELDMSEEATIVAMGQKAAKELTPYRKTRPKRLLSEFPKELLQHSTRPEVLPRLDLTPFSHLRKAS